jgi:hypothetical protein
VQLLKNFPSFYGTRRFITAFTRALHWSLSWARSIKSTPSHPISLRSILIWAAHLRLGPPSCLFPSATIQLINLRLIYVLVIIHSLVVEPEMFDNANIKDTIMSHLHKPPILKPMSLKSTLSNPCENWHHMKAVR